MKKITQAENMLSKIISDIDNMDKTSIKKELSNILSEIISLRKDAIYEDKNGQEVIYDGVEYPSVSSLARHLGTHNTTIYRWIFNGRTADGIEVRFKDPNRKVKDVPRYHRRRNGILLNGVVYKNMAEAARTTGYSISYVKSRCVKL